MKFIISVFFLITSNLSFGQAMSDTTMFIDGDSLVIYGGITTREPKVKGDIPLPKLIRSGVSAETMELYH